VRWITSMQLIVLSAACLVAPSPAGDVAATMVADALDWYAQWGRKDWGPLGVQTCRGELRDDGYTFRCDPVAVVVNVSVDDSGNCIIRNIRASISAADGLLRPGPIIPAPGFRGPDAPRPIQVPGRPKLTPTKPLRCGELPLTAGTFSIKVTPRGRRGTSRALTERAWNVASSYWSQAGVSPAERCIFYCPNVKEGDPFFHLYQVCDGRVDAIWEFEIGNGVVADYARWTYERRGAADYPPDRRLKQDDFWFGKFKAADLADQKAPAK
jgi:hypothetical protein